MYIGPWLLHSGKFQLLGVCILAFGVWLGLRFWPLQVVVTLVKECGAKQRWILETGTNSKVFGVMELWKIDRGTARY